MLSFPFGALTEDAPNDARLVMRGFLRRPTYKISTDNALAVALQKGSGKGCRNDTYGETYKKRVLQVGHVEKTACFIILFEL